MSGNKFPVSYHLMAGIFALSTAVGRRAAAIRGPVVLYPPQSVLILGPSAIGKSQTLYMAAKVLEAFAAEEWENEAGKYETKPGWSLTEQGFTPRGLMEEWARVQLQQGTETLEGGHIETEMSKVINPGKKGSEGVNTWIITALEHRDMKDLTGMYGKRVIRNVTVAFAFASTLQYLRKVLNADEFAGGMMHRFLIVHEREGVPTRTALRIDKMQVQRLAQELREIQQNAPPELVIGEKVKAFLDRLDRQQKYFKAHQLAGFWGRFADLTMKVAQVFTLAEGSSEITMERVEKAETLMRFRLAPLLGGLVEELDAPEEFKKLLDLADSLETTGPKGWSKKEFFRRTGKTDPIVRGRMWDSMQSLELGFVKDGRIYGRQEWVPPDSEPDLPDEIDEDPKNSGD